MTSRSVGRSHGIDGDYLGQVYKDHLSGYEHWDQKAHAKEWILTAKNMGRHLSIDESMYCGRLYTFVSNKDAHGGRGTVIAIIAGVKAATVLRWLLEIPEEERRGVLDVSMDFSDSMKLIAQTAFPNARISLDRFHVFQDLNRYFMKAFSDVRDKVLVAIKHEKAAYDRKVERCAKNRRTYRVRHPKRYKGRKRGRKAKWRKKDFKPSTMKNGESKMDFLRRSFYTLRTCPDKWSDEQWERMNILFEEFPELKEAFDLKEEFRKLYWSKRDKEEYKDSLPAMEERNALKETVRENLHVWFDHVKKSKSPGMKTFMRTIKEREEDLLNYYETSSGQNCMASLTCRSSSTESVRYMDDWFCLCLCSHAGLWRSATEKSGCAIIRKIRIIRC